MAVLSDQPVDADSPRPAEIPKPDPSSTTKDVEATASNNEKKQNVSAFKSLGWLDRLLALWILLAMAVGIILGNFVPETGPALEKGKFVGVSIPIGKCPPHIPPILR